jgi:hypothetical protein
MFRCSHIFSALAAFFEKFRSHITNTHGGKGRKKDKEVKNGTSEGMKDGTGLTGLRILLACTTRPCARTARYRPGCHIAGFQPCDFLFCGLLRSPPASRREAIFCFCAGLISGMGD